MARVMVCPPPVGWHANCADCDSQYLSVDIQRSGNGKYSGQMSDDEAQEELKNVLESTADAREALSGLLKAHGDVILTRWSKKSKDKRAALLGSTTILKPSVSNPTNNHPMDRWIRTNGNVWSGARWLSVKPFAEDRMRLLSLLHARTAYPASAWALLDTRESMMSFGTPGLCELHFNVKCVKMYGDEYGMLADWDDKMTHSWAHVGFPRAFMTLCIQKDILLFLCEMVRDIVQGPEAKVGSTKWDALGSGGFRGSGCEALWSSYTSPAFAPPTSQHFDPWLALQKAEMRLNVIRDDIWLMQIEPKFMHHYIRTSRASIVYDEAASVSMAKRWDHLAQNLLMDVMHRLGLWYIIVLSCKKVCSTFGQSTADIAVGKTLPPAADKALGVLGSEIHGRTRMQSHVFDGLMPSMGPLKDRYTAYQSGGSVMYRERPDVDSTDATDRLAYHLASIQQSVANGPTIYGLSMHSDLLDRELLSQGPASQMDKCMIDQLTDIMTLDEMFHMWIWNQYGHGKFHDEDEAKKTPSERHRSTVSGYIKGGVRFTSGSIRRIGTLMRQSYEAPWPKANSRKNMAWFEQASESRRRLAAFWQAIREELRKAQVASGMDMERSPIDTIAFDSEPEFLAELEQERRQCEEGSRSAQAAQPSSTHESSNPLESQTVWGNDTSESRPVRRRQTKAKAARATGVANSSSDKEQDEVSNDDSEQDRNDSPILVKQDSLSVINKMFRTDDGASGSVRWVHFVQALEDAGFTPTEAGGSAVTFAGETGSIQFHRPHPDPDLKPVDLRNNGRRMQRRFNWSRERFQVRGKESQS